MVTTTPTPPRVPSLSSLLLSLVCRPHLANMCGASTVLVMLLASNTERNVFKVVLLRVLLQEGLNQKHVLTVLQTQQLHVLQYGVVFAVRLVMVVRVTRSAISEETVAATSLLTVSPIPAKATVTLGPLVIKIRAGATPRVTNLTTVVLTIIKRVVLLPPLARSSVAALCLSTVLVRVTLSVKPEVIVVLIIHSLALLLFVIFIHSTRNSQLPVVVTDVPTNQTSPPRAPSSRALVK